jgi:fibronectin type 3 domain-containing protein
VPPGKPVVSFGTVTSSQVVLQWSDVQYETSYRVDRSEAGAAFQTIAPSLAADTTGYTDNNSVKANTSYTYRVTASNASGNTDSDPVAVTTPAAPAGSISLSVSTSIYKRNKLRAALSWSWTGSAASVDVWRGDSPGSLTAVTTTANDTAYTDSPPGSAPTTLYYQLCFAGGTAVCSTVVTATWVK